MINKGPFLPVKEAVKMAGINIQSLRNYEARGYLELHFAGGMVYYRDLLKAAWRAQQDHMEKSGRPKQS
jgi:DNA-binding transcriptional MerR regulator